MNSAAAPQMISQSATSSRRCLLTVTRTRPSSPGEPEGPGRCGASASRPAGGCATAGPSEASRCKSARTALPRPGGSSDARQHGRAGPRGPRQQGVRGSRERAHVGGGSLPARARRASRAFARDRLQRARRARLLGLLGLVDGRGPQRYDANVDSHHHFRCRACNSLHDVDPDGVRELSLSARGYRVESAHVLLEGMPELRKALRRPAGCERP
jgi:hypothetical protein